MSNPFDQFDAMPRGLRNNNPLNITGSNWSGQTGSDGAFAQFDTPEAGRAAADQNLQAYYSKHGINTVSGVVSRWAPPHENDTASYIKLVSGKLGVAPDAPLDLTDPAIRSQLLDAMQEHETGVPVQRQANPFDQFDDGAPEPAVTVELPDRPDLGKGAAYKRPPQKQPIPQKAQAPQNVPDPTIAQDVWSGFAAPFIKLGHDVAQDYRDKTAAVKAYEPPSLADAAMGAVEDLGRSARYVGDLIGLTGAPVQAVVRPIARGINRLPARPYTQDTPFTAPRPMYGDEAQAAIEGSINTALSAAAPATKRPPVPAKASPMTVDQLRDAKNAAYQAVDQMGVVYSPKAQAKLADDIGYELASARINPKVTPKAHAMMEEIQAELRSGKPLSMTEMDQMRQSVQRATGRADDAEQFFGSKLTGLIDSFVDSAGPAETLNGDAEAAAQALVQARELNKRYRKVQTVSDEVESANLRASSTYAGGNKANAVRQELRPLIDPTSGKRVKNLTPKEAKALKKVVHGTGGANAWRVAGKVLDPRGLLGATMQAVLGVPTHGIGNAVAVPAGMFASEMSNRATMSAVDQLLRLLATGEVPKVNPPIPILTLAGQPPVKLASIPGLAGAAELAAPLARTPSASPKAQAAPKAKAPPRRK